MDEPARSRAARWAGRCPCWAIGLTMALTVVAIDHYRLLTRMPNVYVSARTEQIILGGVFILAMFMPGAINRWKWWHICVMFLTAAVTYGIYCIYALIPLKGYSLTWDVYYTFTLIAMVGLGEMFLRRRMSLKNAVWIIAGSIAVSSIYQLVFRCVWLGDWTIHLRDGRGNMYTQVWDLASRPMETLLIWLAIPACLAVAESSLKRRKLVAGMICAAMVGGLLLFQRVISFQLARETLVSGKPFNRDRSAEWLIRGDRSEDYECMWQIFDQGEWTHSGSNPDSYRIVGYWRQTIINALAKKDSARLAERLSAVLISHPREDIAEDAAEWMAQHKRYEAVPLLMRYAMDKNSECIHALLEMKLPVAALPFIRSSAVWTGPSVCDFKPFDTQVRAELTELLGKDAGTNPNEWCILYFDVVPTAITPLTTSIQKETDRVIQIMIRYSGLATKWHRLCAWRVQQSGFSGEQAMYLVEKLRDSISKPNLNVIDTDALEKEVDAYQSRIEATLEPRLTTTAAATTTTPATSSAPSEK